MSSSESHQNSRQKTHRVSDLRNRLHLAAPRPPSSRTRRSAQCSCERGLLRGLCNFVLRGLHLVQRTRRGPQKYSSKITRLAAHLCAPWIHRRSPASSRSEPVRRDGTVMVVPTALNHLGLGARLPRPVHYVEPRAHNGKLSVTGPTQRTVETQPLDRPKIPVTAPTHLPSQLWPRGHTSGSPPQSPLETETPAGATRERAICPAQVAEEEPCARTYERTAANDVTVPKWLLHRGSEYTGNGQKHPLPVAPQGCVCGL